MLEQSVIETKFDTTLPYDPFKYWPHMYTI